MATSNDGSSSGEDREAAEVTPASLPVTPTPLQPASIETIMTANQDVADDDAAQTPVSLDAQTINELTALKQSVLDINSKIHHVTTSAPQIERVLAESLRTPFTENITKVHLRKMEKLHLPTFDGVSDPSAHVTSFNIAMRRANLSDEEKDTGFCQLFIETLEGIALNWFTSLQENSVDSFYDLSTAFLKNYIMFTRQEATATDLWNLNHANGQTLRDFMEKFKSIVSKVDVPDHIAVESLMNTLHIKSPFRADLYRHPTRSVPDAIARSNNFIRMEEDTRDKAAKEAAGKQTPAQTNDARQEPCQHSTSGKPNHRKGYMNAIDDGEPLGSAAMAREKGWNHWDRDTSQPKSSSPEPANSNAVEPSKWCSYHEVKSHDTKDCKVLYGHFLKSIKSGKIEIESPQKPKNNKSWSKNKEKKIQKSQAKAPQ
ncbi:uncharacterized protein LOC125583132 [Brassica napus]|uniref:uncharacterized protein LOC125583132 n=1 Tax=Brassica napus TaxID=3708 RepID=UPI00207B04D2|nr:uncharacterized protein LOC125583132 [Brassica napus]